MLFNTWTFAVFFVLVFGVYHSVGRRQKHVLLLGASYFFYGWWDWRFLGLLAASTVVDFCAARAMGAPEEGARGRRRKALLLLSLCVNLGILGAFKYFNFFVDSAAVMIEGLGLQANLPSLRIILPVGISFYTFQTMAYTIDVYRGRMEATKDPLLFAIYVAYFPQLVAGPIERAQNLLPQIDRPRIVDPQAFSSGLLLILIGLVRKVVIADNAARFADAIFADTAGSSSLVLLRGAFLFGIQIYGDFAGYSDMARGTSRLLGIDLMRNFNHPYFSTSITEFWRRWHVSLSTWLRDYLYIPLGGNRGPTYAVYRNLLLTMLLGGLWHGAAWTFVVWGAIHGVALAVHKALLRGQKAERLRGIHGVAGWAVTMAIVWLAWVFFRAPDFASAFDVLRGIFAFRGGFDPRVLAPVAALVALLLLIDLPQFRTGSHTAVMRWSWPVRGLAYACAILVIVIFHGRGDVPFVYFQF